MCNDDIRNYNSKISDLGSLTLLILSKTDLMHIGNIEIFLFHYGTTYTGTGEYQRLEFMLSIRKLTSVVKDVDLEAMPSSIFVNDDDDDDNIGGNYKGKITRSSYDTLIN